MSRILVVITNVRAPILFRTILVVRSHLSRGLGFTAWGFSICSPP